MNWVKDVMYPRSLAQRSVNNEAFNSFVRQFNLAETYHKTPYSFCNVDKFMSDGRSVEYTDHSDVEHRLLPESCGRHSAAYKDAEGHILVMALPNSIDEPLLEQWVHKRGWVAVILDKSRGFYHDRPMYVVINADTYECLASQGRFDGWGVKVLR